MSSTSPIFYINANAWKLEAFRVSMAYGDFVDCLSTLISSVNFSYRLTFFVFLTPKKVPKIFSTVFIFSLYPRHL